MTASQRLPRLIAITDASLGDDAIVARARRALEVAPEGEVAIQLRDRVRQGRALLGLAERLHAVCVQKGARLIVNDRLDVALALGIRDVHLGDRSVDPADARRLVGAGAWISMAAHAPAEVLAAALAGADAVLLAPIFPSPGKGPALGVEALTEARALAPHVALYALGGVDAARAPSCMAAGARGVAAISFVFRSEEAGRAVAELLARL